MHIDIKNHLITLLSVSIGCILISGHDVQAQMENEEAPLTVNLESRWRLEANMLLGFGFDELMVGKSDNNDDIKISSGGGFGGSLYIGYGLSENWDLSFGILVQNSSLQPQVENAKGNFFRTAIGGNVKYCIAVSSAGFINVGGGLSYYLPGNLDVDLSQVSGGAHNIYGYDNAMGFQLLAEYEGFFNKDLGWMLGLKYSSVRYNLKSAESDGVSIPIKDLPAEITNDVGKLDGSSIDFVLSLAYYF